MSSILSKAQIKHFSHLVKDTQGRIDEQLALIADELVAIQDYSPDRSLTFLDEVREKLGDDVAGPIEAEISALESLQQQAGFLLGYYTAKHPEWLLFEQPDRGE